MKKTKTTIHDIARKLNITASTVSRALNDHPHISDETKKAVRKTAEKLQYRPNNIAAALRNGKSNILGIIVPTADRSFFSSAIRGIEEIANNARYHVMICQTYDQYEKEVSIVQALLNARVDGIMVSHAKETKNFDHFLQVQKQGTPLILFDRYNDDLEVSQVSIDDHLGAFKATTHLIEQGCSRIAHFTNTLSVSIYKERHRGYKDALLQKGLPYNESLVIDSNLQQQDGWNSMEQLWKGEHPDGVFSSSAYAALGALQFLKANHVKVPQEVSLVGFSNEPFTSVTEPSLTIVDQHSVRMGTVAAEIFLREIADKDKKFIPQKMVLKPELIIRQSSMKKGLAQLAEVI